MGQKPIQLVVVMAVRNAVSAATNTFTAISIARFFIHTPPFFARWLTAGTVLAVATEEPSLC